MKPEWIKSIANGLGNWLGKGGEPSGPGSPKGSVPGGGSKAGGQEPLSRERRETRDAARALLLAKMRGDAIPEHLRPKVAASMAGAAIRDCPPDLSSMSSDLTPEAAAALRSKGAKPGRRSRFDFSSPDDVESLEEAPPSDPPSSGQPRMDMAAAQAAAQREVAVLPPAPEEFAPSRLDHLLRTVGHVAPVEADQPLSASDMLLMEQMLGDSAAEGEPEADCSTVSESREDAPAAMAETPRLTFKVIAPLTHIGNPIDKILFDPVGNLMPAFPDWSVSVVTASWPEADLAEFTDLLESKLSLPDLPLAVLEAELAASGEIAPLQEPSSVAGAGLSARSKWDFSSGSDE